MSKTRQTLSALDSILAELADDHLKPGEFTALQVYEQHKAAGGMKSQEAIRGTLKRKETKGDLVSRPIVLNGNVTNAYRVP